MAAALHPSMSRSSYSRFGNGSSAPLPLIPRRYQNSPGHSRPTSRSTSPDRAIAPACFATPSPPAGITVQAPTPSPSPPSHNETRRASFDTETPTARASRHTRSGGGQIPRSFFVLPPERSTPMPVAPVVQYQTPVVDEPTPRPRHRHPIPRELMMTPRPRPVSADAAHFSVETQARDSRSVTMPASTSTPALPLKLSNGKPLKSSLKSSSRPRLPLTVVTTPEPSTGGSKSAPATPYKAVHFDAKLEHVKLFLAEQKPLAVSRNGSPTDDMDTTSADEFPAFIYGKDNGKLVMQRLNFPETPAADSSADVALESATLAADTQAVNGVVRVRNLAFEKWVAIRFTFDDWQTTSEVTARYVSGVPGMPDLDRFAFVIKLHDLLPGRERSLMFAIRYTVLGREIWDSFGGQNYRLRFYHEPAALPKPPVPKPKSVAERQVEDLRSRLEAVVRKQQDGSEDERPRSKETVGSLLAQHSRQRWQGSFSLSPSPVGTPREEHESLPPLRFRNGSNANSRYSFTDAFRDAKTLSPGSQPTHTRTNTFPGVSNTVQWPRRESPPPVHSSHKARPMPLSPPPCRPALGLGSPRDAPEFSSVRVTDDEEDEVNTQPFARRSAPRVHSRGGGYFDLTKSSTRLTPPVTPLNEPQLLPPRLSMSPSPSPETSSVGLPETPSQSSTDDESPDGPDCDLDDDNIDTPATPRPGHAWFTLGAPPRAKSVSPTPTLRGRAQTPLLSPGWRMSQLERTSSEDSALSDLSASELASSLVSPTELTPRFSSVDQLEGERRSGSPTNHLGNYAVLLDKFCFFTGDPSQIPRNSSSSSVEELSSSPRLESTYRRTSPHYSPTTSGAATPVAPV